MLTTWSQSSLEIGVSLESLNIPVMDMFGYSVVLPFLCNSWIPTFVGSHQFYGRVGSDVDAFPVSFAGFAPNELNYDPLVDYSRYSFPLGEVVRLSSLHQGVGSRFAKDGDVRHVTVHGEVRPIGTSLYTYSDRPFFTTHRREIVERNEWNGYAKCFGVSAVDPWDPTPVWLFNTNAFCSLDETCRALRDACSVGGAHLGGNPLWPWVVPVWSFGLVQSGFYDFKYSSTDITWTEYVVNFWSGYCRVMNVTLQLNLVVRDDPAPTNLGGFVRDVNWHANFDATYATLAGTGGFLPGSAFHSIWSDSSSGNLVTPTCFALSSPWDSDLSGHPLFSKDSQVLKDWAASMIDGYRWIRPSVNLVLTDLIDDLQATQQNWIEFGLESEELLELFPSEQLARVIGAGEYGSLAKRIREVAGAVAGGYLLYSFGWSPLVGTPSEAIQTLERFAARLDLLTRSRTLYASRKFDFQSTAPDLPTGLPPNRLTTRIRATCGGFDNSPTSALFQLNASGVLPTPSRLWDATKGSFLLDYKFQVGARQEVLEAFLLSVLLDLRDIEISYTYEWDVPTYLLSRYGLESDRSVTLKLYVREKTRYVPALFAAQTAGLFIPERPNWGIVLALLVSFFT